MKILQNPEFFTDSLQGEISDIIVLRWRKGEKIVLGLTVPVEQGRKGFTPNLLLMGPGITDEGKVAERIEVPEKYGVKVFPWILPESPVYEPFTPGAFYSLSTSDLEAPESGNVLRCS